MFYLIIAVLFALQAVGYVVGYLEPTVVYSALMCVVIALDGLMEWLEYLDERKRK